MTQTELDELEVRLRNLANQADPVTQEVRTAARAAYSWRRIDTELAELTYDSLMDEPRLAGVRSGGGTRQLTFEAPGLTVEVEVSGGAAPRLVGQLVPSHPGAVEMRHEHGSTVLAVDHLGRFAADQLPAGPLSLRCTVEAFSVETEWVAV